MYGSLLYYWVLLSGESLQTNKICVSWISKTIIKFFGGFIYGNVGSGWRVFC